MPKVSVIVPSYGHSAYIGQCIESVLAQTFTDWELVIVDDRGPDESVEIAKSYGDPRIKVHVNEVNLGTYGTQNRCLDLGTGDCIAVLNSDDYWRPTKLERQVELFEAHRECSFCYTLGWLTEPDGTERDGMEQHGDLPRAEIQQLAPWLVLENRVLASSVMFRRGAIRFDPSFRYSGDHVALLHLIQTGPAAFVDEPLSTWRLHESNAHRERLNHFGEEIRLREGILSDLKRWHLTGVDEDLLRRKLGLSCVSLASVYTLCGDLRKARAALRRSLRIDPGNRVAQKRLVLSYFPLEFQNRRMNPDVDWHAIRDAYPKANLAPVSLEVSRADHGA